MNKYFKAYINICKNPQNTVQYVKFLEVITPLHKRESSTNWKLVNFLEPIRKLRSHGKPHHETWRERQNGIRANMWIGLPKRKLLEPQTSNNSWMILGWTARGWVQTNIRLEMPGDCSLRYPKCHGPSLQKHRHGEKARKNLCYW